MEKLRATFRRDEKGAVTFVIMSGSNITNEGVVHLRALTNLQSLDLMETQITDAGLVHLKNLTNLKDLSLAGCKNITDSGVAELQKALPNCEISR